MENAQAGSTVAAKLLGQVPKVTLLALYIPFVPLTGLS
jgi:hypothetical protein